MCHKRLIALLLSISMLLYSCYGYKEVIRSDKSVNKASDIYLNIDTTKYKLINIQDFESYYLADAILVNKHVQEKKDVTIYAYKMTLLESNETDQSIRVDKNQIYQFSKTVRNSGKTLTVIGITAIAIIIISVIIEHNENTMKIHPHE